MSILTDLELIQEVKRGHKKAFETLVLRHESFLLKVVARMTRDLDAAQDVVQETFIKVYKRLHLFEGRSSLRSWLYQIALNTARNRFRKNSREHTNAETVDMAVDSEAEKHVMALDVRGILQDEIDLLPERQRAALTLRIYEDLSFKEIAEIMDCPYDTAKANYRHALLKLKARLGGNLLLKNRPEFDESFPSLLTGGYRLMEVDS